MQGTITMQNGEKIHFELYENEAPKTVANFVKLIKEGYYNGKTFHRVIAGFVSQGGCPNGNGSGDLGYTIPCETQNNSHIHEVGSFSMAHRGKDTGCCQFFICHEAQPHLDGVHTVFGKALDNIAAVHNMRNGDVIESIVVE